MLLLCPGLLNLRTKFIQIPLEFRRGFLPVDPIEIHWAGDLGDSLQLPGANRNLCSSYVRHVESPTTRSSSPLSLLGLVKGLS